MQPISYFWMLRAIGGVGMRDDEPRGKIGVYRHSCKWKTPGAGKQ